MRLIHPTALRVGKMDRWTSDQLNLNQSVALTAGTIQTILQSYLGNVFNMFIVKCDVRSDVHRNSIDVSAVFYKYIQRARLVKSRRMALLIAAGIFKTKPPLYYVRLAQGFVVPDLVVTQLQTLLHDSFGVHLRLHLYNLSQVAETQYRKLDRRALFSIDKFMQYQQQRLEQTDGVRDWPPLESRLERDWINPLAVRESYHRYKSSANLAYALDVLMVVLYSSMYKLSSLLADVIVRGLLRNMKRHKQFLGLISATLDHFRSFSNWPFKPDDWCIALHGKLGSGTVRSRSFYIKTGYLPLQTIILPIDYAYRSAETKFGSIGVKIWMRKQF